MVESTPEGGKELTKQKSKGKTAKVTVTEHHFRLGVDKDAGNFVDHFHASFVTPGETLSKMGSIYLFENALGFFCDGTISGRFVWNVPLTACTGMRTAPFMGLDVMVQDPKTLKSKTQTFMYILSRGSLYAAILKHANMREFSAGEARKKGRVTTVAEQQAALERANMKHNLFSYCAQAFKSRKLPVPKLPTTYVDSETEKLLFVQVFSAKDLAAMDYGGVSDPYAMVKVCGLQQQTQVINETLNPEWNEVFSFPIAPNVDLSKETMQITLYDWDLTFHDFLGWAELPLSKLQLQRDNQKNSQWLGLTLAPGMKTSSWVKKYITMEGDIAITGEIFITVWVGTRKDPTMNYAKAAERCSDTVAKDGAVECFAEPQFCVLHLDVDEGKGLLACDAGGVSDPYLKIKVAEGTPYEVNMRTKYLQGTVNPKWNEEFNFAIPLPLNHKVNISVWDKDIAYDELIGRTVLDLDKLPVVKGHKINKQVQTQWYTLKDDSGETENSEGEKYGEVKFRAYLDFEYFYHPQGSFFLQECGRLEVDVLNARDLKGMGRYYVVCKLDGLLAKTPSVVQSTVNTPDAGLVWNRRLNFPVYDTASVLNIALFNADKNHQMVGKIRIHVSALSGNQRYEKAVSLISVDGSDTLKHSGVLDIAVTFCCPSIMGIPIGVLQRYTLSHLPEKHFWKPLPPVDQSRMEARRRTVTSLRLDASHPALPKSVVLDMYDAKESEFALRLMKASIERVKAMVETLELGGKVFQYLERWENPFASMFAIAVVMFFMIMPEFIIPSMMLSMVAAGVAAYPSSYDRQLNYIGMDEQLSIGEAADTGAKAGADEEEEEDPDPQGLESGSLNPLASMQKKYDEMIELASIVQLKLSEVAGLAEAATNLLTWMDPRTTGLMVFGCLSATIFLYFFPLTLFRIKLGAACGFAYVMRPPFMRDPTPGPPDVWLARMATMRDRIYN